MFISVIMSVYNEEPSWLRNSIDSILNQTYTSFEFIIVLDNPDNFILKEILFGYRDKDSRVILIINEENIGLVKSLNKALKLCVGDYIARMDADDISHPDRLEKQLDYIVREELDLIGSNVNFIDNNNIFFYVTNKLLTHKYLNKMLYAGTIGIVHPTFFADKKVYDKLNGYKMAVHAEDQEFLSRVIFYGFKVGNMSDVLLDYRYNDQSITKSKAVYVYKMAEYVVKVFRSSIKTGEYFFDENFSSHIVVTEKELLDFNKKQIILGEARQDFNNKEIFSFVFKMIKSIYFSRTSLHSIKINLLLRWYGFLEKIESRVTNN